MSKGTSNIMKWLTKGSKSNDSQESQEKKTPPKASPEKKKLDLKKSKMNSN
jgi:hypothetical protein